MSTTVSLITNTNESHKEKILELFEESEKIIIAVGFLKNSGLRNIKDQLENVCKNFTKKVICFIGTGLGETDPKALQKLWRILSRNNNNKLVLCTPDAGIFHPKIYVFIRAKLVKMIVGSANLTEAGWVINDESSIIIDTTTESEEYLQLDSYIQNLYDLYYSDDIVELMNDYKSQLENYQKDKRPAFHFKRKKSLIVDIDMARIGAYYEAYIHSTEFIDIGTRADKYNDARANLIELAGTARLSRLEFHNLFGPLVGHAGYQKLWHSGSIHRTTYKTLDFIPGFRNIVRIAQQVQDLSPSIAYERMANLKNKLKKEGKIHGVGENILTEILMSFNPNKFANLNLNPVGVLSFVGKDFPTISSFKGATYQEYVYLLTKIKDELNMGSFLEIDSFFNYVYWNILEG